MAKKTTTIEKQMLNVMVEYTETFLLPLLDDRFGEIDKRFGEIDKRFGEIDKRFAETKYELKDYIDRKLASQTSEIFKRLDKRFEVQEEKDNKFKKKVVDVFKTSNIGSSEDRAYLAGLVGV